VCAFAEEVKDSTWDIPWTPLVKTIIYLKSLCELNSILYSVSAKNYCCFE